MSNRVQPSERIKLAEEDDTLITKEEEVALKLNYIFLNAVINLKTLNYENFDPLSENIDHPTLKGIVKYRKHPSIIAIVSEFTKKYFLLK